ncbi:MAG: hypothetical protein AAGB13_03080 [Cyanobacteria bacterium P01_F01_bin.33]
MAEFDSTPRSEETLTDPTAPAESKTSDRDTNPKAKTNSEADTAAGDDNPWEHWQTNLEQLRQQAEAAWQQGVAQVQMQFDRDLQQSRDRLLSAAIAAKNAGDIQLLTTAAAAIATDSKLNAEQLAVAIRDMPTAAERALTITALRAAILQTDLLPARERMLSRLAQEYVESGFPLVLDRDGTAVECEASAALLTAIVAVKAAEATMAGFSQLFGQGDLNRLLRTDDKLRRKGLKQSTTVLQSSADWEERELDINTLMDLDTELIPEDPVLEIAHLGIQGAQVGEFFAKRSRKLLGSVILPAPASAVVFALQFLTSDLVLGVSNTVGSSLENTSARRRIQLLLESLPEVERIPTPEQFWAASDKTLVQCDRFLYPLLAQQLTSVAGAIDPQLRNVNLNRLGRQFNQLNPLQFLQGWMNGEWLEQWRNGVETLSAQYPKLESLQQYRVGIEQAASVDRLMDQAVALREAALALDSELADDLPAAATR